MSIFAKSRTFAEKNSKSDDEKKECIHMYMYDHIGVC